MKNASYFCSPKYTTPLKQISLLIFFLLITCFAQAQQPDSVAVPATDSARVAVDSSSMKKQVEIAPLQKLLEENSYINTKDAPTSFIIKKRNPPQKDALFYLLAGLIFFFGIIRTVYDRYFTTLFRVFFNSSLRQSQLTDQLLQSKLPSLFFNLVFLFAGGFYAYFLFERFGKPGNDVNWLLLGSCIGIFMAVYIIKYLTLKFVGWVTGYRNEADTYTFVLFLINKIIGICLLPVIVILSFSESSIAYIATIVSFLLVGILLLLRFFRSYSLLQHKLNVSRFHFILYILAMEILPLLLIYKAVSIFIVKSL